MFSWFGRQLVTFVNGSTTVTNTYDADGLRGTKTVNGETTTYQYIDGKLMYESRPGIELYYFYDSYGNLTSIRYIKTGETTAYSYYVTTNAQGDVLGIYTAAGVQVAAYEYDAWGNCTVYDVTQDSAGNNIFTEVIYSDSQKFNMEFLNPFRYRGYYYDQDMGLYYLQSRYYDPQVGRFLNSDMISDAGSGVLGYNTFIYCGNNPINFMDSTGYGKTWNKIKTWFKNTFGTNKKTTVTVKTPDRTYGHNIAIKTTTGTVTQTSIKKKSAQKPITFFSETETEEDQIKKNFGVETKNFSVSVGYRRFSASINTDNITGSIEISTDAFYTTVTTSDFANVTDEVLGGMYTERQYNNITGTAIVVACVFVSEYAVAATGVLIGGGAAQSILGGA